MPIDQPPWSALNRGRGERFRCPGCRKPVAWHIQWADLATDLRRHVSRGRSTPATRSYPFLLISFSADGKIEAKPFTTEEEAETFLEEKIGLLRSPLE